MRFDDSWLFPLAAVAALAMAGCVAVRWWKPLAVLERPAVLLAVAAALTAAQWVFGGRGNPLPLIFALSHTLASRGRDQADFAPVSRVLESRVATWIVAVATSALTLWVWGGPRPVSVIHDEEAYVLQARIFASGRWADPPPPVPEFFEQAHVLVDPRRAAKYPPGHALVLAPGAAAGLPAAVPILLAGVTGALLYARARSVAGPVAGILTWLVWVASPLGLRYRSSFFSEITTSLLFLLLWTGVARWRSGGRTAWLVLAGAAGGFGAITRPLTMLLIAIPFTIVVLRDAARRRAWPAVSVAAAAGVLPLLLIPLWSTKTTGDVRVAPLTLYTRQYLPFDVPGLGLREDAPARALPQDLQRLAQIFANVHRTHQRDRLPAILQERVTEWMRSGFGGGVALLLPIAVAGLFVLPREGWLSIVAGALLLLGYLAYAHFPSWSVYYLEALVPLALAAGVGLTGVLAGLPVRMAPFGLVLAAVAFAISIARDAGSERALRREQESPFRRMEETITGLPAKPAIVFVRYAEGHNSSVSLIRNGPDVASAPIWIVYDRGADNARLRAVDPSRSAYLYDEDTGVLAPLDSVPSASPSPPL